MIVHFLSGEILHIDRIHDEEICIHIIRSHLKLPDHHVVHIVDRLEEKEEKEVCCCIDIQIPQTLQLFVRYGLMLLQYHKYMYSSDTVTPMQEKIEVLLDMLWPTSDEHSKPNRDTLHELVQIDWAPFFDLKCTSSNITQYLDSIWPVDVAHEQVIKWAIDNELVHSSIFDKKMSMLKNVLEVIGNHPEFLSIDQKETIVTMMGDAIRRSIHTHFSPTNKYEELQQSESFELDGWRMSDFTLPIDVFQAEFNIIECIVETLRSASGVLGTEEVKTALRIDWDNLPSHPFTLDVYDDKVDRTKIAWSAIKHDVFMY